MTDRPVAVVSHLSGRYRGKLQRIEVERSRIGTGADVEIRFSEDDLTPTQGAHPPEGVHAVVARGPDGYALEAALEADVWVNGARVEERLLESGDVIEIGEGGPVLRFRLYPAGSNAYKSVAEVFADCKECVRLGQGAAERAGILLAGPPRELLTATSPLVRVAVGALMVALLASVGLLWQRHRRLQDRIERETAAIRTLVERIERDTAPVLGATGIAALRDTLGANLARIEALERASGARGRTIAAAAQSVALVQGAWGIDDAQGRPMGVRLDDEGFPTSDDEGSMFTAEPGAAPLTFEYTGTAFLVGDDGLLLTNRHVALPWESDGEAALLSAFGYVPVIRRLIAWLPGLDEPIDVTLVRAAERFDVALLRGALPEGLDRMSLPLLAEEPSPGDEIVVLGYPLGLDALLVRADPDEAAAILGDDPPGFWDLPWRLAQGGLIEPLATVGVIGQVTAGAVIYDAETTHGGSGGPVLDLEGRVLAVNAAVLTGFAGSNMGVPAAQALRLLKAAEQP